MVCGDMRYLYGISAWVYNCYQKSKQAGHITQIDRKARENMCYKSPGTTRATSHLTLQEINPWTSLSLSLSLSLSPSFPLSSASHPLFFLSLSLICSLRVPPSILSPSFSSAYLSLPLSLSRLPPTLYSLSLVSGDFEPQTQHGK